MSRNPFSLTKNDILDAFNLTNDDLEAIEKVRDNLNYLPSRNSNVLDPLQGYGATARSPSWNINQNVEPSSTPNSSSSCKPFSNLNLNSVDEEDEFLYGDSNSVPEEQMSSKEVTIINSAGRNDTGWSDDEDPYGDSHPLSKLNSRLRKNLSESESQSKFKENAKFPHSKREENTIHANIPSRESVHEYASHKLQSDDSLLSTRIEKNNLHEVSSTLVGTKSKYHAAAEVLKKRTVEKSSSIEKLDVFPGTSKSSSELDKSLHLDLKTDKSAVKKRVRTLSKRHIDNVNNIIIRAQQQQKRSHPHEDFLAEKHAKYETSRTSSFSPSRRHSPHRPLPPSHKPKFSHTSSESDYARYAAPYSRPRSPNFDSERRHHSRYPESHRRYSPSPKRWSRGPGYRHRRRSRERSPDYNRRKDRSPRSRRSRSRSPGYYSSRNKTYDKRQRSKSPKKTDYCKKKEKYSSGESFCSLSLGSSSSSSSDSSDSSDERKNSRKSPAKIVKKDSRKFGDEIANSKASVDVHSKKSNSALPPDDLSKKLSDIFNLKDSDGNSNIQLDSDSINQLLSASLPSTKNQLVLEFLEKQMHPQQQPIVASNSSTYTSPAISGLNIVPNMQMMPSSDSYVYPSVPPPTVQYMAPQMPNFPSVMPSAAFPAPVMAAPPPTEYGPYLTVPPVSTHDSQYVANVVANAKSGKVSRPSTLRTIPVSDNLHATPISNSNITVVPTNYSLQKSEATPKIQESKSSQKSTEWSLENKLKNLKEKNSASKHTGESGSSSVESTSEKNKLLIIEKYKRLKSEKTVNQKKAKSASEDLKEMREMFEDTFGRKPSPSDKILHSRCKNLLNLALDYSSQCNKLARHSEATLSNFKGRLSTSLQEEVSKLKVEPIIIEETPNEIVSCLDQGGHLCWDCCIIFPDVKAMLNHYHTAEHIEQMKANLQEWKRDFVKTPKEEQKNEEKNTVLKPIKGAEFLKHLTGSYCALCREIFTEVVDAEQHLKGHQHYMNYLNHIKENPLYEKHRFDDRNLEINLDKEEKIDENIEMAHKNGNEDKIDLFSNANELKVKEDLKEIHSDSSSEDENLNYVQKVLAGKIRKDDLSTETNTCKKVVTKTAHKFVFIGKSPSYRRKIAEKDKPWYKRESILNLYDENSSADSNSKEFEKKEENNSYV